MAKGDTPVSRVPGSGKAIEWVTKKREAANEKMGLAEILTLKKDFCRGSRSRVRRRACERERAASGTMRVLENTRRNLQVLFVPQFRNLWSERLAWRQRRRRRGRVEKHGEERRSERRE